MKWVKIIDNKDTYMLVGGCSVTNGKLYVDKKTEIDWDTFPYPTIDGHLIIDAYIMDKNGDVFNVPTYKIKPDWGYDRKIKLESLLGN